MKKKVALGITAFHFKVFDLKKEESLADTAQRAQHFMLAVSTIRINTGIRRE